MMVTVLLPELILAHAILEFAMALRCMREMEERLAALGDEWGPEIQVQCPSWMSSLWSTSASQRRARARLQTDSLSPWRSSKTLPASSRMSVTEAPLLARPRNSAAQAVLPASPRT